MTARRQILLVLLTLAALLLIDVAVALVLASGAAPQSLVRYFDYGRSVPGKLAQWEAHPGGPGNLYETAWRPEMLAASAESFAEEAPGTGPVLRVYGLSFVNHVVEAALEQDPDLRADFHSGPGAPPNFTYAMAMDDAPNRRAGDVAVLGLLSSAVPAMASFSNRVWAFEQPAPVTYPVFRPGQDDELLRQDPRVESLADQRDLSSDPEATAAWRDQLKTSDALYTHAAFALPWLDISPFARLVRRAAATAAIRNREAEVRADPEGAPYPYATVLRRMVGDFAETARADGQLPVVMLVQTRDPSDVPLLDLLSETLEYEGIPYFATEVYQDPREPRAFLPDGHYTRAVNQRFGEAFRDVLEDAQR